MLAFFLGVNPQIFLRFGEIDHNFNFLAHILKVGIGKFIVKYSIIADQWD